MTTAVAVFQPARLPWADAIGERFAPMGVTKTSWKALTEAVWPTAKTVDGVVLALSYCQARNLDPFKKPVHVVPVWSSALGREVEGVWPGISELRTTAMRTANYAGCDETLFGPDVPRDFAWSDKKGAHKATVVYPEWAQVTVYRFVGSHRVAFVGPKVFWTETYATASRSTDAPNEMWRKRPRGQIDKCAEAAALRKAFPEEIGNEQTAEEMAGQWVGFDGAEATATASRPEPQPLHAEFEDGAPGAKAAKRPPPAAQDKGHVGNSASAATPGPATPAAAQEAEIPHNPETGEVEEEPTQPAPDEVHFLDGVFGERNGRRATFKNGLTFSSVKWDGPATPLKHRSYALTEEALAELFGVGAQPEAEDGQAAPEPEVEAEAEAQDEVSEQCSEESEQSSVDEVEEDGFPPEMSAYIDAIEEVPDWIAVKAAMKTFYTSETFKGLSTAQQNKIRGETWATCVDRKLPGLPDQAADVSAFRLWLEWIDTEDAADAILGTLRALEQDAEFAGKDDTFKAAIRKAAADRMTALGD